MGKKKSFTSSALASLTGESKTAPKTTVKEVVMPVAEPKETAVADTKKAEPKVAEKQASVPVATSNPKPAAKRSPKKKKSTNLQDPNKRSIKKANTPVTLYLNATNLDQLKEYAEKEEQKISWLIDEMIYEYLSDKIDG